MFLFFVLMAPMAGFAELAVAPGTDFDQVADGAVADHFADAVEVFVSVALGADLGSKLVFVFEIICADDAGFLDAVGEGFFAIDVFAAVHRPVCDESVGMIGSAADDGVHVLLIETLAPVHVFLGGGKFRGGEREVFFVDVA